MMGAGTAGSGAHHAASDLREAAVEAAACSYLEATEGDLAAALRVAVADLLDAQAEAAWRQLALDHWVSRGYVRGPAAEVLERPHVRRALIERADQ